jgi:hypothetical protein
MDEMDGIWSRRCRRTVNVPGPREVHVMSPWPLRNWQGGELTQRHWSHYERKDYLWHGMVRRVYVPLFRGLVVRRKKERTNALVVSTVLAGFRAIDTGQLSSAPHA